MSTQVAAAKKLNPGQGAGESTPVVIKTGGSPDDPRIKMNPPPKMLCSIEVVDNQDNQTFNSRLVDKKWESAKAPNAAILQVQVDDSGSLTTIPANSPGLAVLQIFYGSELLMVQEVPQVDPDLTTLSISSSIPFAVPLPDEHEWSDSTAEVPAVPPIVLFTQGSQPPTKVTCATTDVTVTLTVVFEN